MVNLSGELPGDRGTIGSRPNVGARNPPRANGDTPTGLGDTPSLSRGLSVCTTVSANSALSPAEDAGERSPPKNSAPRGSMKEDVIVSTNSPRG